jgi:phenylalanyl-tRNA synthetase beta chain
MKVSVEWLSEFVSPLPAPEELARRLTRAGLEVEGMERPAEALRGVVVARITAAAPHPDAAKLTVTQVEVGAERLQVVCGAKNFQVGDLVPLATVGTTLPGGPTIQRASLRGVESHGMLCSGKELGVSDDASGLLVLPKDLVPGTPLAKALGLEDTVLEVNVTPNRGDALSHLGVAREAASVLRLPLQRKLRVPVESDGLASDAIRIEIADPVGCPRFTARVLEGVRIGPSPAWLRRRLERCGVRSISNVVDVTNYVMLELGQPMHAFDLDRIQGGLLRVRRAREGEPLVTLDGKQRTLVADDLVIEDVRGAQSLAGTMGGADTEVNDGTTRVLLEAANWDPGTIRRMARRHQLHSEASYRFERGVDRSVLPEVLDHAAALMAELSGATVRRGRIDVQPRPAERRTVALGRGDVETLLGAPVPEEEVRSILSSLGFVAEGPGRWRVRAHPLGAPGELRRAHAGAGVGRGGAAHPRRALRRGLRRGGELQLRRPGGPALGDAASAGEARDAGGRRRAEEPAHAAAGGDADHLARVPPRERVVQPPPAAGVAPSLRDGPLLPARPPRREGPAPGDGGAPPCLRRALGTA